MFLKSNGRCPHAGAAAASQNSHPLNDWTLIEVYEAPVNHVWALASTTRKRVCALRLHGYFKFGYGLRDNLKVPRIPLSSSASGEFDFRSKYPTSKPAETCFR